MKNQNRLKARKLPVLCLSECYLSVCTQNQTLKDCVVPIKLYDCNSIVKYKYVGVIITNTIMTLHDMNLFPFDIMYMFCSSSSYFFNCSTSLCANGRSCGVWVTS